MSAHRARSRIHVHIDMIELQRRSRWLPAISKPGRAGRKNAVRNSNRSIGSCLRTNGFCNDGFRRCHHQLALLDAHEILACRIDGNKSVTSL